MQHELIAWEWAGKDPGSPSCFQFIICLPCQKASVFVCYDGRAELAEWCSLEDLSLSSGWRRVPFDRVLEAL